MKTQILQLEAHDDVISILDKIGWAQTERVLLVLPRRGKIFRNKLDLLRLRRQSERKGCQLALVTDDSFIKALAVEANIPIYRTIQKAHQAEWQSQKRPALSIHEQQDVDKPPLFEQLEAIQALRSGDRLLTLPIWVRILVFVVAILAVSAMAAMLTPSAVIRIKPPTTQQTMLLTMVATDRVKQARISGEVPISIVKIAVNGSKTAKVSGLVNLPKDFAQGEVVLTNLTDQPIEVPAGTVVRTLDQKPRRYATQQSVVLQAGSAKSATVPIQALKAGESENAQPNEIRAVEGFLGLKVSVENPQPILGGNSITGSAPSQRDRQFLLQLLQAELIEKAKENLLEEIQAGDILLPDSTISTRIIRQQYTPAEQIATDILKLDLELEVSFRIVDHQSLRELGDQVFASSLPSGHLPLPTTSLAICQDPLTQSKDGDFRCSLKITRDAQMRIDPDEVRNLVVREPIPQASALIQKTYALSEPPVIELFPRWLPFLPWLPMRIEVIIEK